MTSGTEMTVEKRNAINDIKTFIILQYSGDENTQTGSMIFSALQDCADSTP